MTQWYERNIWKKHAQGLFDYHAQQRGYLLRFAPGVETAYVIPKRKECVIGPNFKTIKKGQYVRHLPSDEIRLRETWLEAYIAHEAAHVRFSFEKPHGVLGELWNMLEDERIERLQSLKRPPVARLFDFLGDVFLHESQGQQSASSTWNGCLLWRWGHDHPDGWEASNPDEWAKVKPLVEMAWAAPNSDVVSDLAQKILEILGINEQDPIPETIFTISAGGAEPSIGTESVADQNQTAMPKHPGEIDSSESIIHQHEGNARAIAAILRPATKPSFTRADRSRGRFDFERYQRGSERQFKKKVEPHKPDKISICIALDVSGSMSGIPIDTAANTALLFSRSCELSNIPFALATFGTNHTVLGNFQGDWDEIRKQITSIKLEGTTELSQTLNWSLEQKTANHKQIVIIITDGELDEWDYQQCQGLVKRFTNAIILPILICQEKDTPTSTQYRQHFGRILEIHQIEQLAPAIKSWINAML